MNPTVHRGARDYHLVIVCTGRKRHKRCELAVLIPVIPRADLALAAAMGATIKEPEGEYAEALARGWGVQGSFRRFVPGREINVPHSKKTPVQSFPLDNGDVALRLQCFRCHPSGRIYPASAAALFAEADRRNVTTTTRGPRVEVDITEPAPRYS